MVLDISDITKKYAERMEYLATVRDGNISREIIIMVDLD